LLPLILCAALLYAQFSSQLERSTRQSLDGLLRSFGMTIMARLGNAADDLKVIVAAPGATDTAIQTNVAQLPWVAHVILTSSNGLKLYSSAGHPQTLSERQMLALSQGAPLMVWGAEHGGPEKIYLLQVLASGSWLYVELSSPWLWADAADFAGDTALTLRDDHGRTIASTQIPSPRAAGPPAVANTPRKRKSEPILGIVSGQPLLVPFMAADRHNRCAHLADCGR
jgi:hypothetical protein